MADENQQTSADDEPIHRRQGGGEIPPKRSWPEVVGLNVEEAKKKIMEDRPSVGFKVLPIKCFVPALYVGSRVYLFVDSSGKIARTPHVG